MRKLRLSKDVTTEVHRQLEAGAHLSLRPLECSVVFIHCITAPYPGGQLQNPPSRWLQGQQFMVAQGQLPFHRLPSTL